MIGANMTYIQEVEKELSKHIRVGKNLLSLYSLLVMSLGEQTTLADVHDAWAIDKNKSMPDHRSIIPFDELTPEVQELDRNYVNAIHKTARILKERGVKW